MQGEFISAPNFEGVKLRKSYIDQHDRLTQGLALFKYVFEK